jgi:hypothetical protein
MNIEPARIPVSKLHIGSAYNLLSIGLKSTGRKISA